MKVSPPQKLSILLASLIKNSNSDPIIVSDDGSWVHCRALMCSCREDVKSVECDHKELAEIPLGIPVDVGQLSLQGTKFGKIPEQAFKDYPDLFSLILSKGQLTSINNQSFIGLSNLETLDLSMNKFTTLGEPPDAVSACIEKDVEDRHRHANSNNNFHSDINEKTLTQCKIPDTTFEHLTGLRELYLGFNNIHCISGQVFSVIGSKLLELHLEHNDITKIEEPVFKYLVSLERLDLSGNHLEYISSNGFENLGRLKELLLYNNRLSWISSGAFKDFTQLTYLKADKNNFAHIRDLQLSYLPSLEIADLQNNNLISIEESSFAYNKMLQKLFLADNNIADIEPHSFISNRKISYIDLRRNQLNYISQHVFDGLESIKFLLLDSNRLVTIDQKAFFSLSKLISLSVSQNLIVKLHGNTFTNLKKLQYLNLGDNKLMVPEKDWFNISNPTKVFSSTTEFVLSGNNWRCDCSMFKFKQWANETRKKEGKYKRQIDEQLKTLSCKTPYYLKDKNIRDVPLEAFECNTRSHVQHTVEDYKPLISFSVLLTMIIVCMYKFIKYQCQNRFNKLSAKQIHDAFNSSNPLDLDKHKQI